MAKSNSTLSNLPRPLPVYDTSDLAGIASLPDLAEAPGEKRAANIFSNTPRKLYNLLSDRARYRTWLTEARVLASQGVRPGPSHTVINAHPYPTWSGAFASDSELPRGFPSDPLVIFGVVVPHDAARKDELPYLPTGYPWQSITVQSGGMACHHPRFIGFPLKIRKSALGNVYRLASFADLDGHHCVGLFGNALSTLGSYERTVSSMGLSANTPYEHLEEAVYPLDITCAKLLSKTKTPKPAELYSPVDDDASWSELASSIQSYDPTSWGVFILGKNCD